MNRAYEVPQVLRRKKGKLPIARNKAAICDGDLSELPNASKVLPRER